MFHDMGVVCHVRVNNYLSKRKLHTKNYMSKQGLIAQFTNMFSYPYSLFRFIHCNFVFNLGCVYTARRVHCSQLVKSNVQHDNTV